VFGRSLMLLVKLKFATNKLVIGAGLLALGGALAGAERPAQYGWPTNKSLEIGERACLSVPPMPLCKINFIASAASRPA